MKKRRLEIGSQVCMIGMTILAVLPIIYVFAHSLTPANLIQSAYGTLKQSQSAKDRVYLAPFVISLEQYSKVFLETPKFLYLFWNACFLVVPIVAGQTVVGIMAAYGMSQLKFKGSDFLFFTNILMMLMPFQVTLVPQYIVLSRLGMIKHASSIILPGIFGSFATFFLKQFMDGIHVSYLEEARLLGASEWKILWLIVVPICKPIITSVCILLFLDQWNMVDQPIHFLEASKYPLSVFLSKIVSQNIGIGFAGSMLYMALPLMLTFYGQEELTNSMRLGSLK